LKGRGKEEEGKTKAPGNRTKNDKGTGEMPLSTSFEGAPPPSSSAKKDTIILCTRKREKEVDIQGNRRKERCLIWDCLEFLGGERRSEHESPNKHEERGGTPKLGTTAQSSGEKREKARLTRIMSKRKYIRSHHHVEEEMIQEKGKEGGE